ncbi:MAG: phosphatase PAP2 family protein [Candidatus Aenigmarchaeota archaeon]|nr:phosphatase PAP2 family protein [Candidatus Aenigmarchaeota archaeon]
MSSYGAFNVAYLMEFISEITFVVIAVGILPFAIKERKIAADYFALVITTAFFSMFFQEFFMRPRPPSALGINTYSFPSTHSSSIFAWAEFMSGKYRRYAGVFYLFSVLVAVSRVYIGAHYPIDVLAGAILGLLIATVLKRSNNYGTQPKH